jgi:hypothetical protein
MKQYFNANSHKVAKEVLDIEMNRQRVNHLKMPILTSQPKVRANFLLAPLSQSKDSAYVILRLSELGFTLLPGVPLNHPKQAINLRGQLAKFNAVNNTSLATVEDILTIPEAQAGKMKADFANYIQEGKVKETKVMEDIQSTAEAQAQSKATNANRQRQAEILVAEKANDTMLANQFLVNHSARKISALLQGKIKRNPVVAPVPTQTTAPSAVATLMTNLPFTPPTGGSGVSPGMKVPAATKTIKIPKAQRKLDTVAGVTLTKTDTKLTVPEILAKQSAGEKLSRSDAGVLGMDARWALGNKPA